MLKICSVGKKILFRTHLQMELTQKNEGKNTFLHEGMTVQEYETLTFYRCNTFDCDLTNY